MDASTGKTIGIILVVLIALAAFGVLRFLVLVPLGIVDGAVHGFHAPHFERVGFWLWPWAGFAGFFGLLVFFVWIAVVVWVYGDAEKRGLSGVIWALVVFFTHFVGLVIYALVRSGRPVLAPSSGSPAAPAPPSFRPPVPPPPACVKCGKPVEPGHAYCPACGEAQMPACTKCGRFTQKGWVACPYCGEKL